MSQYSLLNSMPMHDLFLAGAPFAESPLANPVAHPVMDKFARKLSEAHRANSVFVHLGSFCELPVEPTSRLTSVFAQRTTTPSDARSSAPTLSSP